MPVQTSTKAGFGRICSGGSSPGGNTVPPKPRPSGKRFQLANACICSRVRSLTVLLDYRYGIIVFREVRSAEPILTPGKDCKNELRNAKEGAIRRRVAPTSFWPSAPVFGESFGAGTDSGTEPQLFIDATGWIGESGSIARNKRSTRLWSAWDKEKGRRDYRAATKRV